MDTPRSLDNGGGEMYKPCIHSQYPHIYTITFVWVVELCAMLSYVVLIHDLTICWDPDNWHTISVQCLKFSVLSPPRPCSGGVKFPVTCDSSPRSSLILCIALTASPNTRGNIIKHFGPMMAALSGLLRGINVTDIGAVNIISSANTCQLGSSFI